MLKNILSTLCVFCIYSSVSAQSTVGLIAHWDMNGGTTDVTGNGHNGTASNITPAVGRNGLPNTAYYFNGINSIITAPYMADLNLTTYSICAIVNVKGFYTGLCQANTIMSRGRINGVGGYALYFEDNAWDGNDCSAIDSTKNGFKSSAGTGSAPASAWQYSPSIVKDKWYKMVGVWNGTHWKLYSDDTLRVTVLQTGGSIGSSTDSLSIGTVKYQAASGYPYHFKGIIDDIKIYNRVLSDSEIKQYGDTCGKITLQPTATLGLVGSTKKFFVSSDISTPTYKWQQDAGTGYVDLTNSGPFSGVTTDTLRITGVTATLNGNNYRCKVSNAIGCSETSTPGLLSITVGVNEFVSSNLVNVYPNPAQNNVIVTLPFTPLNGTIQLLNEVGVLVSSQKIGDNTNNVNIRQLPAGLYTLRIECDGNVIYKKLFKN
jgi:hypothetical protein